MTKKSYATYDRRRVARILNAFIARQDTDFFLDDENELCADIQAYEGGIINSKEFFSCLQYLSSDDDTYMEEFGYYDYWYTQEVKFCKLGFFIDEARALRVSLKRLAREGK